MFNTLPVNFKNYEVLQELGQGGFGVVYLARDTYLNRLVALKMLHPHIAAQPNMTQRFLQEAQAMARLDHVNIVRVNRVEHDSQAPFFEMEYVEGSTLSAYRGTRVLSIPEAIPILKQIAYALDVAHQQKIIHRDVKPANVLIKANGELKLTDFGIAKLLEVTGTEVSLSTDILGTPSYISPEQANPSPTDEIGPGSDIYGLGVVAYQLLTGRLPFERLGHYAVILYAHVHEPPANPRTFNRYLSPAVANVLLQVLAKEPANRYPTAIAFVEALEQADWAEPVTSTAVSPAVTTSGEYSAIPVSSTSNPISASAPHLTTATPPITQNPTPVSSNNTFLRMMIGFVVGLLVAIIVVGWSVYSPPDKAIAAESTPDLPASTPTEETVATTVPTNVPEETVPTNVPEETVPTNVPEETVPTTVPTNVPEETVPTTVPTNVPEETVPTTVPANVPEETVPTTVPADAMPAMTPAPTNIPAKATPATTSPPINTPSESCP